MKIPKFISLLCLAATLPAAATQPQVWTYRDCVEYARINNISLKQSQLSQQVTGESLAAAKAQWQPSLDFGTSHSFSNAPWGEDKKNSFGGNFNLSAAWTVYDGGVRENNIKFYRKQQEIDELNTTDVFRNIETELLSAYLNILYADESVKIYENALKLSTAQAERARQLMEAGKLSRVDYVQLEAQQQQDQYALVSAKGQYATRKLELKKLLELGLNDSIEIAPEEFPEASVMAVPAPADETFAMAKNIDAQLQALTLESEQSVINESIARAERLPKIALSAGVGTSYYIPGGNFGRQLRDAIGEQIGLSLSLPIFDRRSTKTAVAKAKLEQLNVELSREQRENDLSQSIENWYINARDSQSKYTAALAQEKASQLSNELINEKFTLGLVEPVELLTSHNNLLDARHATVQAKYMSILALKMIEYYRTANITLP